MIVQEKKRIRAGCYVRVSTENQIENYSIEEQIERLTAFCKAKDYTIIKFYTDGGYTGGNTNRPALQQLLTDVWNHKLDTVVVYKLDRLSRSQKDTLLLIEDEFLINHVDFVSMNENFDTSTPFGKAMIGILSVFAQLEKDQITERFTMGRIGRSRAGYYHGGAIIPKGYQYSDGNLIIDEYKALQVREIFNRFLSGHSVNSIQKEMNEKYGGWKSAGHVLNVLRNSVYIGKVKFKGCEYNGLHKPIIETEKYNTVQELLKYREKEKRPPQKTPFRANYLLSSLIFCAHCGARYSANHGFYKCYSRAKSSKRFIIDPNCKNSNWEIHTLDHIIINEIKKLSFDKAYLDSISAKKDIQEEKNTNEAIQARLIEIEQQISKMIDLYQVGNISLEQISHRIEALQKEKDSLMCTIIPSDNHKIKQDFMDVLSNLDTFLDSENISEKRMFISSLIEAIWIDGNQVKISWRI